MKLRNVLMLTLVVASLALTGCASKKKQADSTGELESTEYNGANNGMNFELNGDSDSQRAGSLKTVYFAYSSSALTGSTLEALEANAEALKANPSLKIQVEGHCDERGSVEFNLALGEKRAASVRDYLISNGIAASRISTISLGKEKPMAFGHDEDAWSKNRRANFVITEK